MSKIQEILGAISLRFQRDTKAASVNSYIDKHGNPVIECSGSIHWSDLKLRPNTTLHAKPGSRVIIDRCIFYEGSRVVGPVSIFSVYHAKSISHAK